MGIADFLAEAGRNTAVGRVGEAFGGQTSRQRSMDSFINQELPALADQIHKAATKEDIAKAGQALIASGLKAGINPQGLEKLMDMTVSPALQNLKTGEIDKLRVDYGAQPAQPRPEGTEGPLTPQGNFVDPTAEKPIDLNFAMRLGQATGANPDQFRQMIGTPTDIAGKQLSNQKTQASIDQDQAKEKAIQGLSNTPLAEGQPSAQATARINPPGLMQFMPQRDESAGKQDYQNQLLGLKQQGLENSLSMAQQRIGAANDRAGLAESRAGFNQAAELRKEFQSQSKDFQTVRDSFNRINTALQSQTPAGDMAAVYNWMKAQDPRSTVRESEFAMAATAKPLLERMGLSWDALGGIWEGKKLTPGQRADFAARSKELYNAENQQHQKRVGEYKRLATGAGLRPEMVITDMEATGATPAAPATAPSAPAAGQPGQQLDAQTAAKILQEAGGDKNKAREIAKQRGYRF